MIATLLHLISWLPLIAAVIAVAVLFFMFRPLLKIADVIPGSIWLMAVIILVGMLGTGFLQVAAVRSDRDAARQEAQAQHQRADKVQGELTQLEAAVTAQKKEAAAKLAAMTADRDRMQAALNDAHRAQEIKDGNAKATNDRLAADLRRMSRAGGGIGLRDPNASGCGGGSGVAASATAAGSNDRPADAGPASGVLSKPLEELLLRIVRESDDGAAAYASCRADAYRVRGLPAPADP